MRCPTIRDNIHLDEFHKMAGREFGRVLESIDERIVQTFCSAAITEKGIDLAKEGLAGPSATWTYLISDNPFGDVLQRHSEADDD
jgi:preprotein translocase subunit SecA